MTGVLYNEIEPFPAEWLARLSAAGEIAQGDVDTRSIVDLQPSDLTGRAQFHAFAGIGVWSRALRDAGVLDDFPVWTGSCPCQPFSNAGSRKGFDDARHLWPAWGRLIQECHPPVILGEQVASPAGRAWLDAVFADLEGAGYACGAANLSAAGVGAPHRRERIYFVAHAEEGRARCVPSLGRRAGADEPDALRSGVLAHTDGTGLEGRPGERGDARAQLATPQRDGGVGNAGCEGGGRDGGAIPREEAARAGSRILAGDQPDLSISPGFWSEHDWVECVDGKWRPTEPGVEPVVDGSTFDVERTRAKEIAGYGNAIVLPLAVEFIRAALGL